MVERVIDFVLIKTATAILSLHEEHDVAGSNPVFPAQSYC